MVCPLEYNLRRDELQTDGCTRNPVFLLTDYNLPKTIQSVSQLVCDSLLEQVGETLQCLINSLPAKAETADAFCTAKKVRRQVAHENREFAELSYP